MTVVGVPLDVEAAEKAIRDVPDPEIPIISIHDLGIVRGVEADGEQLTVTITPTYSGCPAVAAIAEAIDVVGRGYGFDVQVRTQLSPAWTTDWLTERGRQSLRRFGIAPPHRHEAAATSDSGPILVGVSVRQVSCPQCGSGDTEELSRFSGTACKALRRCRACAEPFEEFKAL